MRSFYLLSLLALAAGPASAVWAAQSEQRNPAEAAKAFSLDLPSTPAASTTPQQSEAPPPQLPPAAVPDAAPTVPVGFTLDSPIAQLIADPRAKAVLDRDLPGMSDDPNLLRFSASSLRQLQPMTGGQLTDALLSKTAADLAAIGGPGLAAPATKTVVAPTRDRRMESGR